MSGTMWYGWQTCRRITRLTDATYYAVIIIDGPAGRQEVDARPSDAVDRALVTGAAIRADRTLLDEPVAPGRPEWRDYPTGTAELAPQAMQLMQYPWTCEPSPS